MQNTQQLIINLALYNQRRDTKNKNKDKNKNHY